jgi:hypothetical protein
VILATDGDSVLVTHGNGEPAPVMVIEHESIMEIRASGSIRRRADGALCHMAERVQVVATTLRLETESGWFLRKVSPWLIGTSYQARHEGGLDSRFRWQCSEDCVRRTVAPAQGHAERRALRPACDPMRRASR